MTNTKSLFLAAAVALSLIPACDAPKEGSGEGAAKAAEASSKPAEKATSKSTKPTDAPKKAGAPAAPAEPADDPASLTIEDTAIDGFGTVKLPKGAKKMTLTDTLAYYSWRAGGKSITAKISRNGGRTSLKAAKKWAGLDAGKAEVTEAREVSKGVFEVELHRESDGTNFVVRFDANGRMSCMGVGGIEMDVLLQICGSYPIAA